MISGGLGYFDNSGPVPKVIDFNAGNPDQLGEFARRLAHVAGPGGQVSDAERLRLIDVYQSDNNALSYSIYRFLTQVDAAQLTKVLSVLGQVERHLTTDAARRWSEASGFAATESCVSTGSTWCSGAKTLFQLFVRSDDPHTSGVNDEDVILGFVEETPDHSMSFGIAWSDLMRPRP